MAPKDKREPRPYRGVNDEIREQNAKLKNAPLKEKLSYFKEYYLKTTLAVIAILIFVGSLAYTMITAPDDTAFAAYFFNDTGDSSSTVLIDEFVSSPIKLLIKFCNSVT